MSNTEQLQDIRQTQMLNAPIEKVWKFVSTEEGISAWFMPPVGFEAVVGHEFKLNAGPFGMSPCIVTSVEPPHRLTFNWGKDWFLTFELKTVGDQTEFTLIHGGWDINKVTEFGQPHAEVRGHMAGGWSGIGEKLKRVVEA